MFLRPCRAVAEHMVQLVTSEERLQFPDLHAEQTFISWWVAGVWLVGVFGIGSCSSRLTECGHLAHHAPRFSEGTECWPAGGKAVYHDEC